MTAARLGFCIQACATEGYVIVTHIPQSRHSRRTIFKQRAASSSGNLVRHLRLDRMAEHHFNSLTHVIYFEKKSHYVESNNVGITTGYVLKGDVNKLG